MFFLPRWQKITLDQSKVLKIRLYRFLWATRYTPPPIGQRKTYYWCILIPVPWARLHQTISPSSERKRICYSFILSKLMCNFTMVTCLILVQKHYTNNPTTRNTSIIAHVAILMAWEGILCTWQWSYMKLNDTKILNLIQLYYHCCALLVFYLRNLS